MNWRELKDFCNQLPESELEEKVIIWRESESITDVDPMQLEEDHYIDPDDYEDGCFAESESDLMLEDKEKYPNGIKDLQKVYSKGNPILVENF